MQWIASAALLVFAAGFAAAESGAPLAAPLAAPLVAMQAAAVRGDTRAQTELALKYENAEGVPRDFQKARTLYCRAARRGDAEAQFRLGWVYANGRGVPRDDGVAAALFGLAADQGHPVAARLLRYIPRMPGVPLPACMLPDPQVGLRLDYGGAAPAADSNSAPGGRR